MAHPGGLRTPVDESQPRTAVADLDAAPPVGLPRRRSPWSILLLLAVGVAAAILLFYQRPEGQAFYPRCSFHAATGLLCPGCGGMRATHELLHLRVVESLRCNLFVPLGPLVAAAWVVVRRRRGLPLTPGVTGVWLLFAVLALYTLARNLPWSGARWLGP